MRFITRISPISPYTTSCRINDIPLRANLYVFPFSICEINRSLISIIRIINSKSPFNRNRLLILIRLLILRSYKTSCNLHLLFVFINQNILSIACVLNIILPIICFKRCCRHARRPNGHAHGHAQQHGFS